MQRDPDKHGSCCKYISLVTNIGRAIRYIAINNHSAAMAAACVDRYTQSSNDDQLKLRL